MATAPATWPIFDVAEIAQEASERAGLPFRSGYDLRTARRALELLSIEWSNRGLNLWSIDGPISLPLLQGQDRYTLADDTVDIIEFILRLTRPDATFTDYSMERFTLPEYASITNKLAQGRPSLIHVRREIHPYLYVWMTAPANINFSLVYWRLRRLQSLGSGGTGAPDIPWRFIPAITAGLAFYMALKSTDPNAMQRVQLLKGEYQEQFELAAGEDRDRAAFRFVPGGYDF